MNSELSAAQKAQYGNILQDVAENIDLTPTQYEEAEKKYNAVAEFLTRPGHELSLYSPKISCQGSMRTGTPVRPVVETEEFDVDLTCRLEISLPAIQADVKALVGNRFKGDGMYAKMICEKRRCWRLRYSETTRFHLDIVPALPIVYGRLLNEGVPDQIARHLVAITDNERADYKVRNSDWQQSNPEGYAIWFLQATETDAKSIREQLIQARLYSDISKIPDYRVRTPLQRAVQLMKRHRDVMFDGNDDKPISVIITTLAAVAYTDTARKVFPYGRGANFYELLVATVEAMPKYIDIRHGREWVANPVNPSENFADKWAEKRVKRDNFFKWHKAFLETVRNPMFQQGLPGLAEDLKTKFGARPVNEAFSKIGSAVTLKRESGILNVSQSGLVGAGGTPLLNHVFHGKV